MWAHRKLTSNHKRDAYTYITPQEGRLHVYNVEGKLRALQTNYGKIVETESMLHATKFSKELSLAIPIAFRQRRSLYLGGGVLH